MEASCSYKDDGDAGSELTVQRFKDLLMDVYRVYKRDKVMPKEKRAYCNGYADALLISKQIDNLQLQQIIDLANMEVFGMTLKQRQYEFDIFHEPSLLNPLPSKRFPRVDSVS